MQISSHSEDDTQQAAQKFAPTLKNGDIVCLRGDLGAGKTVFCRHLIRALCDDPALEVPSPTFTLVQHYDSEHGPLWHFDLYRLEDPEEIYETGWEEARSEGIILIEWPERLGTLLPAQHIDISIKTGQNERIITITRPDHPQ